MTNKDDTAPTRQSNADPRPIHRRAMAQTEAIVAAVEPGQLGLPTPCAEYDVRALLSHIVGGLNRVAIVGEGGDALARPPGPTAFPTTAGWPPTARPPPGPRRPGPTTPSSTPWSRCPWGKIPGRFAIAGYVQEILTHGWDLAKATGQPTERDPELASWALAGAQRILPPEARGDDIPFGSVVPVPPDAAPYAQLAAWLGRQP